MTTPRRRVRTTLCLDGHGSGTATSSANGLNQVTQAGADTISYDARGNVASDGVQTYSYSSENRLTHIVNSAVTADINYDPLGRYIGYSPTATTSRRNVHDGAQSIYLMKDKCVLRQGRLRPRRLLRPRNVSPL